MKTIGKKSVANLAHFFRAVTASAQEVQDYESSKAEARKALEQAAERLCRESGLDVILKALKALPPSKDGRRFTIQKGFFAGDEDQFQIHIQYGERHNIHSYNPKILENNVHFKFQVGHTPDAPVKVQCLRGDVPLRFQKTKFSNLQRAIDGKLGDFIGKMIPSRTAELKKAVAALQKKGVRVSIPTV